MARAILKGVLAKGIISADRITLSSPSGPSESVRATGARCTRDNAEAVAGADIIILAVKPMFVAAAISSFKAALKEGATLVSVAAGVSTNQLEEVSALVCYVALDYLFTIPSLFPLVYWWKLWCASCDA